MAQEITLEFVWKNVSEATKKKVVKFWMDEKAITKKEDAETRANELLTVAYFDKKVVGVATGVVTPHPQLKSNIVFYRTYISESHRGKKVAQQLFIESYKHLNSNKELKEKGVLGILIAFQSPVLVGNYIKDQKPVLEEFNNLTFIGVDKNGIPLRISYFDDVKIKM
ncbi:MAG: GNAT family N-acetyltransferase [Ekhidna sp.]|uniref:GNAT family N-acetyltransferase n=1 Tax=Ekhidna sp. TaxID=2608089 RepID=UPI0032EC9B33